MLDVSRCRHQLCRRGAAAADRALPCSPGGKVRVSDRRFLCGGQTATVMAACAALGLRSGYLGAFGSDEHGRLIRNALTQLRCRRARLDRVRRAEPRRGHPRRSARQPHGSLASQRSVEAALPGTARVRRCRAHIVHVDDDDPELAVHAATFARSAGTASDERSRARLGPGGAVDCVGDFSDLRAESAGANHRRARS